MKILLAFAVAALVTVACGTTTVAVKATPAPSGAAASSAPSPPTIFNVGDTIEITWNGSGGKLLYSVLNVTAPVNSGNSFITPKSGQFMQIAVAFTNNTTQTVTVSSFISFELRDTDGQGYSTTIFLDGPKAPDGDIAPGDKLAGTLSYDVAVGKTYKLYYKVNSFDSLSAIVDLGAH